MPTEIQDAMLWALMQTYTNTDGKELLITKNTSLQLVDAIRQYFNANNIDYETFSYDDLIPYLPN